MEAGARKGTVEDCDPRKWPLFVILLDWRARTVCTQCSAWGLPSSRRTGAHAWNTRAEPGCLGFSISRVTLSFLIFEVGRKHGSVTGWGEGTPTAQLTPEPGHHPEAWMGYGRLFLFTFLRCLKEEGKAEISSYAECHPKGK